MTGLPPSASSTRSTAGARSTAGTSGAPAIRVAEEVVQALADGRPVVALESTIFTHGLPRPRNLAVALEAEQQLRAAGVVPATIGVHAGVPTVGLSTEQITELSATDGLDKVSLRDLPVVAALGRHGGTTVAATAFLAHRAGIRVFSTGGLGGVHFGASESFDESADMTTLAATPVTVISAGVKSILDIRATLERFETLNIPVIGYRTRKYPGFYVTDSGHEINFSVETLSLIHIVYKRQRSTRPSSCRRRSWTASWPAPGRRPNGRASPATPRPRSCSTTSSATPAAAAWRSTSRSTGATSVSAARSRPPLCV